MENTADIVVNTIKDDLHINIDHAEIIIAHRLRPTEQNKTRPIIAKLLSRSKKSDIMNACVTIKPNIYINESLTPKRCTIDTTLLAIRKQHRDAFQQWYTRDGRIFVKLRSCHQKYMIINEDSLNKFLDKFPILNQS